MLNSLFHRGQGLMLLQRVNFPEVFSWLWSWHTGGTRRTGSTACESKLCTLHIVYTFRSEMGRWRLYSGKIRRWSPFLDTAHSWPHVQGKLWECPWARAPAASSLPWPGPPERTGGDRRSSASAPAQMPLLRFQQTCRSSTASWSKKVAPGFPNVRNQTGGKVKAIHDTGNE